MSETFLIIGVVLVALGSFLAGVSVGLLPKRGRRKGRHSVKGRHTK